MEGSETGRPFSGQRLASAVGRTCIVVLDAGTATEAPTAGGHPMRRGRYIPCSEQVDDRKLAPVVAGCMYRDAVSGLTVLCTRSGNETLAVHGRELLRVPRTPRRDAVGGMVGWHAADTARLA